MCDHFEVFGVYTQLITAKVVNVVTFYEVAPICKVREAMGGDCFPAERKDPVTFRRTYCGNRTTPNPTCISLFDVGKEPFYIFFPNFVPQFNLHTQF